MEEFNAVRFFIYFFVAQFVCAVTQHSVCSKSHCKRTLKSLHCTSRYQSTALRAYFPSLINQSTC